MKIEYSLTPAEMKIAGSIAWRTKVLKKKLILLTIICALFLLILKPQEFFTPALLLIFIVAMLFLGRFIYLQRISKSPFKNKPASIALTLTVSEDGLESKSEHVASTVNWQHFIDLTITLQGVLLYPQKNIFYFIPATASITDGTWQEFTQLLQTKIPKRK